MSQIGEVLGIDAVPVEKRRSIRALEWLVGSYAVILIAASILLFMINATSDQVRNLIIEQNSAALKLWTNLDYYRHHHSDQTTDTSLPPGLFEELVEFSRRNAAIVKTVHRLNVTKVLSSNSSWNAVRQYIQPTDGRKLPPGQQYYFEYSGVDPRTDTQTIIEQGMYQIELYQAIRDYAQDRVNLYTGVLGAVSQYLLPVAYSLLGAFLYAFRTAYAGVRKRRIASSPDRTSRFLMAAIAGIAVSAFSTLIPQDVVLSPVAIAFLVGYSIDFFITRLDALIQKFSHSSPG